MLLVNDLLSLGREKGIIQNKARHDEQTGRLIYINDSPLVNFVTNNYMSFENDERVKNAAIEGIRKYGFYNSISRAYLSFEPYLELEEKLEQIFELPTYIANNTTQGHLAYLPIIIGPNDAVILDQFVHESVQLLIQIQKSQGCHIEMIKHNQMEMLERRIKMLSETYENVWYMADSVYSMHGDTAPMQDIEVLLNAYDKFHVYIDDAHGMSWIGKNGKGFALHNIGFHEKMYVITSLNKGFGATSSALIFPNKLTKETVSNCGGALRFSTPTLPAGIMGASAIADIHLSYEIYEKQIQLSELIKYFKFRAKELNLPIINYTHTPLFYLGLGSPEMTILFMQYLIKCGFYASTASVPAVPLKHSGIRLSLNLTINQKDIENLLNTIAEYMEDLERQGLFNREVAIKGFKMADRNRELELA